MYIFKYSEQNNLDYILLNMTASGDFIQVATNVAYILLNFVNILLSSAVLG